jgi:hypothetical protein
MGYTLIEITSGVIVLLGCTFTDMTIDGQSVINNAGVISIIDASITIKNSSFLNLQVDINTVTYNNIDEECKWGMLSVIVLNESVVLMKDVLISNTYAGVAIHGGTMAVDNTNFKIVGGEGSVKYPSIERHIRCGMYI